MPIGDIEARKFIVVGPDGEEATVVGGALTTSGGGGGGGGPVTVADGADVVEGSLADAATAAGGAGTVSAKLRLVTTQLAAIDGHVDGVETLLAGGLPAALSGGKLQVIDASVVTLLNGGLPAALVSGRLSVDVGASALPSGGATSALQTSGNTLLGAGLPAALSGGKLQVVDSAVILPASLGQKTAAASLAVVLASDTVLPLPSGAATSAKQDSQTTLLSGGLPAALAAGGGLKVEGVAGGVAQPVSSTTLATAAKQPALGTAGTPSADVITVQGVAAGTPLFVSGNVASDLPVTANPQLGGGRASTAVPSAVSTDGDAVSTWLTRTGATVVDGGVASAATDSGNPVKVGGKYNATPPTFTDGQRGDIQIDTRGFGYSVLVSKGTTPGATTTAAVGPPNADGLDITTFAGLYVNAVMFGTKGSNGRSDRWRNNDEQTLLASAARTATTSSADQTNFNGRGVMVIVNVTAEAGTTTLTLTIEGKDSISSNYFSLITGVIVYNAATDTPTVTRAVMVYPGVLTADAIGAGNANLIAQKSVALPRTWRATITPSDASSQTYSVSGVTIL